jgi:hypothetical protein
VAVSSNSGFFTPTHGGNGRKKRRKRTGVDKLADFVTDNSPERKMVKKSEIKDFINWVTKEYKQQATIFPSGDTINPQPARVDYKKRWGSNEYDALAAGGSKDKEAQKVPVLDEETEDEPFN